MRAILEFLNGKEVDDEAVRNKRLDGVRDGTMGDGVKDKGEVTNGEVANKKMTDDLTHEEVKHEKKRGGMGLNVVFVEVAMLQGDKYKKILSEEVVRMVMGAVASPLLKAVEGGWIPR
ncbi:predicted protein [Sclerotinia sclerotiorum 1980 UF-70]|uniref:Uncharacterized protein n=2 Tax=Sclerotinia sclerotiorum (strain ATCC 18683 / 1980 / Ss-1) TaxID=665079 RepID=A7F471_SCLS1|nr:predicted protein [Sclerotinia sclerotiorum 1980 UF-70]APA10740.1 hypothetical protein sscle_06g055100 [Sclerotinia sclerotiorum 1980 UF-70]EDN97542.1 predicted protein [Sclerotinia sclerotiorum 1980 UF-70]